jgi:hypothetical protein
MHRVEHERAENPDIAWELAVELENQLGYISVLSTIRRTGSISCNESGEVVAEGTFVSGHQRCEQVFQRGFLLWAGGIRRVG